MGFRKAFAIAAACGIIAAFLSHDSSGSAKNVPSKEQIRFNAVSAVAACFNANTPPGSTDRVWHDIAAEGFVQIHLDRYLEKCE